MFKCKICSREMDLIIQEIEDTGYGYYCHNCGTILVTELKQYKENEDDVTVQLKEEEKEWYQPKGIVLQSCSGCYYTSSYKDHCIKDEQKREIEFFDDIPDWCPLRKGDYNV